MGTTKALKTWIKKTTGLRNPFRSDEAAPRSYHRIQLEDWVKTISVSAGTVIDVGGLENPIPYRVKHWSVKNYYIFDNEAGVAFNGKMTIPYEFVQLDLNRSLSDQSIDPTQYNADVIFCLEVFDYIWQPYMATKTIYDLLKPGGIAYFSFAFIHPWHEPRQIDYMRYTGMGIKKLMTEAGFKPPEITPRVDKSGLLERFFQADGMHALRDEPANVTGYMVKAVK